jgi:hypothetical protein
MKPCQIRLRVEEAVPWEVYSRRIHGVNLAVYGASADAENVSAAPDYLRVKMRQHASKRVAMKMWRTTHSIESNSGSRVSDLARMSERGRAACPMMRVCYETRGTKSQDSANIQPTCVWREASPSDHVLLLNVAETMVGLVLRALAACAIVQSV